MPFSIRWYTFIVDVSTYAFKPVLVTFPPAFIHECLTNNEVFKNAVIITIPNLFVKCFFRTVPLLTFVKQVLKLLFVKLVFCQCITANTVCSGVLLTTSKATFSISGFFLYARYFLMSCR